MLDSDYWLDQAILLNLDASGEDDRDRRAELRELAAICRTVAAKIEEHAPGG